MRPRLSPKSVGALVLAAAALTFSVVVLWPSPAPADPTIAWTPRSVNETILAGQSKTVTASFVASGDASNVAIRVVPTLAPFVQVAPSSFAKISKGQSVQVTLTVSAPASALPASVQGTIQLRTGNTLAGPLPLSVNVVWSTLQSDGVFFQYPPTWVPQILPKTGSTFPVMAVTSPAGSDVAIYQEGGDAYDVGEGTSFTTTTILVAGYSAVRRDYKNSLGASYIVTVDFNPPLPQAPKFHIEMRPASSDSGAETTFDQLLQTLTIQ